jgi:FlaA1/EpsC-like NDP-sugar epimerase
MCYANIGPNFTTGEDWVADEGRARSQRSTIDADAMPHLKNNGLSSWNVVERLARRIAQLPRPIKASVAIVADAIAMPIAMAIAIWLRRGSIAAVLDVTPWLFVATTCISVGVFAGLRLYRSVFRFISRSALFYAGMAVVVATVLLWSFSALLLESDVTFRVFAIFSAFALIYMGVSRVLVREVLHYRRGDKERVAIYGAGSSGAQLVRSLTESGQYIPVAFLDCDEALQGQLVAGIKVHPPTHLQQLIEREQVSSVLLAIPSTSRRKRQAVIKSLEAYPVHVRTVPDISDIVAGNATVADVREVDASDLLGRDPVPPNEALVGACIRGKVVMVSGAGGSIGSELCRQIVRLAPKRLLLLEMSEPALYQVDRELRMQAASKGVRVEIVPLLGNVHHRNRLREIMSRYGVQTVYHAAAYKHVPIVEQNIIEGIHNNVYSSWYAAEAAIDCNVETFVLISTDKAVNPTNVMGATKRLAELALQALQERATFTRFCMVRFGNVLESSGSVVPLFREQIKRGGPVTVTHKDVTRYFMTIPEASQLVLQAGAMAQGGDVFVLDMGRPVRIADLAKRMVSLMGLTVRDASHPDGDIEIVYTGLRPAEKLYEELLIGTNVTGTEHPMIMRAMEDKLPWWKLKPILEDLLTAIDAFDCGRARALLLQAVVQYRPEGGIQDLVWVRSQEDMLETAARVTDIRTRLPRPAKAPQLPLGTSTPAH